MQFKSVLRFLSLLLLAVITLAANGASSDQQAKIDEIMGVLQQYDSTPEQAIPQKLLQGAAGIAIIPAVVKVGIVIGGRYGKGVVIPRDKSKRWGRPQFMSLRGGNVGWQIGARDIDILLLFRHKNELDFLLQGSMTLGGDIVVTAGPMGKEPASHAQKGASVYAYSLSHGLYVGDLLDGVELRVEEQDNSIYYDEELETPAAATELINAIDEFIKGSSSE